MRSESHAPAMWNAFWIWSDPPAERMIEAGRNEVVFFRKTFDCRPRKGRFIIHVSADSRYKLYLNGQLVLTGPCPGDRWRQYYESLDVTRFLVVGRNVLAAQVIHFNTVEPWRSGRGGLVSQHRSTTGAFLLQGEMRTSTGRIVGRAVTDESWRVMKDVAITHRSGLLYMPNVGETEVVDGQLLPHGWEQRDYDDSRWQSAAVICQGMSPDRQVCGDLDPWPLTLRPIPHLFRTKRRFLRVTKKRTKTPDLGPCLLGKKSRVVLPANSFHVIDLDAGEYTTGYVHLVVGGGKGSTIKTLHGECYGTPVEGTHQYRKDVRDDSSGELIGEYDVYTCGGRGKEWYEPFWFRAFRYVRLEIQTSDQPLTLYSFHYRETGYPLDIQSDFQCSRKEFGPFWEISVRTLKRCMHEIYEDCPYMEQGQYIMDTRQEALFTYQLSTDDRLARKAIHDFHSSLTPWGLLQCRYPSAVPGIIPTFSLYWIWMLYDHYLYFGDRELIRRYLSTLEAILGWYERHLNTDGLVENRGYFPFIDWAEQWYRKKSHGRPPAARHGPLSMDSLFLVYTLQHAAIPLLEELGWLERGREYADLAANISRALHNHCWSEKKQYFQDGPGVSEYSQHSQVFAVLSDVLEGETAARVLAGAVNDRTIAQISFALSFFTFRALEKTNQYAKSFCIWKRWERFVRLHASTWPEDEFIQRSDCHAWGCTPLYEFVSVILGIGPAEPGYGKVRVRPQLGPLKWARGRIVTPKGFIGLHVESAGRDRVSLKGRVEGSTPWCLVFAGGEEVRLNKKSDFHFDGVVQ